MPSIKEREARRGTGWLRDAFPELQKDTPDLITALKKGLPADRVDKLKVSLDVPTAEIADLLSIPSSTLARRRQAGRLDKNESERTYRIAHLMLRAAEVFGSVERGRQWLKQPQFALGGAKPVEFADTEPGAREVEDLLVRIEHGIPA
ncbi:MAG TPA: antitoxin Xre/MbcA/ParS toxin-binding domain-containing protein [Rhodothermales bacterium]|nr:antitoxin Xre/MbcA/ParS toxin-binding domain-containing protein [Rhodothermales bacterium]